MKQGRAAIMILAWAVLLGVTPPAIAQETTAPPTAVAEARVSTPSSLPVDRDELVNVRTRAEARVVEFTIGPVELDTGMEHLRLPIQMAEFPVDGWIHGFEVEMVDSSGEPIPLDLLHHVNFIDPDKRELFSPIPRRVMAAGRETVRERLPRVIGYPITRGDRMLIAAMFANPLERDFADANLIVRFFYSAESDGFIQPRNVFPFYLDVMGPVGAKDFMVPPGRSVTSWEGSPAVEGRILGIGGHLHDYATRLALIDVTNDQVLWEVEPEGTPGGRVTGVPSNHFLWTLGKKISPDRVYRIEVEYDNPLDGPAPDGGMGAIGGVVWVAEDARWPAFDRQDEVYLEDLRNTLTAPDRLQGHGHGAHGASMAGEHATDGPAARNEPSGHEAVEVDEGVEPGDGGHGH